ncbi:MAG: protein kinase [Chloroflexi bacterium]|nr:protein kinase [Chloroflexota bacterium]
MSNARWIGTTLKGRYRIDALLGQGGMSAVFKATDPNLKRVVAIKLIHPHLADNREFLARFEEEAAAVARLRHPNIVQVYDFDHDGDVVYMVLEFVAGETLSQRVQRLASGGRQMPVAEAVQAISQACDAVDYAHQRGLVHRDIKPANIMIDIHGQAILMDFGIVKILGGDRHTATGAVFGTAHYMSPEQVRGTVVDHRADIYALGVTLYELLGGRPPFSAESVMTVIMMHLTDPVPDIRAARADVPPAVKQVIDRAMAKDLALRYQSAAAMAADLRAALAGAAAPQPAAVADPVTPSRTLPAQGTAAPATPSTALPAAMSPAPTRAAAVPPPPRLPRALLVGVAVALVGLIIAVGAAIATMGGSAADSGGLAKGVSATQTSLAVGAVPPTSTAAPLPTATAAPTRSAPTVAPAATVVPTEPPTATVVPTEPPAATVVPTRSAPTVAPAATVVPTEPPTATAVPTEPPTATAVPTEPPTATVAPTEPPTATVVPALSVRIDAISVDSYTNRYVVEYATYAYTEQLPGVHVHFFFDTVAPENAGVPGGGPWILYGGPRPFTGYALADRPPGASQLCALVANDDHSIQPGSGNCVALP